VFKTIQIFFIGLIATLLLGACGKKDEPVPVAQPATPPAEAVPAATADGIPAISNGVEYPAFRKILIGSGWIPDKQTQECGFNCQGKRRDGLIETQDCADAGIAPCIFIFKNKESAVLKVYTVGENLSVEKTEGGVAGSASASTDKQPTQSANAQPPSSKEINPATYIKALNSSFGPSGWAECINGSVTVTAVSIKYNQTLPADVQKVTGVVEDTLGAMRKQMLLDGVSQSTLDNLIRSQPRLANGDQALKVVGGCYQKMEKILYSLK
jgi:hypothetical protein